MKRRHGSFFSCSHKHRRLSRYRTNEKERERRRTDTYFNAQLWYDNASVYTGIMYVGSCMIIWRDKAALSRHKLNRIFPLSFSLPLFLYRSPPTLSHSDHRKKRPLRRGTHLLHLDNTTDKTLWSFLFCPSPPTPHNMYEYRSNSIYCNLVQTFSAAVSTDNQPTSPTWGLPE